MPTSAEHDSALGRNVVGTGDLPVICRVRAGGALALSEETSRETFSTTIRTLQLNRCKRIIKHGLPKFYIVFFCIFCKVVIISFFGEASENGLPGPLRHFARVHYFARDITCWAISCSSCQRRCHTITIGCRKHNEKKKRTLYMWWNVCSVACVVRAQWRTI